MNKPKVIDIDLHQDDRGYVYCPLDNLDKLGIKRTYIVENLSKGVVRAWHLHLKGDTYFYVLRGAIKAVALKYDPAAYWSNEEYCLTIKDAITTVVLSERKPQLFFIPKGHFNGFQSLTDYTKLLVYSTLSFKQVKKDDKRLEWYAIPNLWKVDNR